MNYLWRATEAWKNIILYVVRDVPRAIVVYVYTKFKDYVSRIVDMFILFIFMLIMLLLAGLVIFALLALLLLPPETMDTFTAAMSSVLAWAIAGAAKCLAWAGSLTLDDGKVVLDWGMRTANYIHTLGWSGVILVARVAASTVSMAFESVFEAAKNKSSDIYFF